MDSGLLRIELPIRGPHRPHRQQLRGAPVNVSGAFPIQVLPPELTCVARVTHPVCLARLSCIWASQDPVRQTWQALICRAV